MLQTVNKIPSPLKLAQNNQQITKVQKYRKRKYKKLFPQVKNIVGDPFDTQAFVLYTDDNNTNISSTARMVVDSQQGLPEDDVFPSSINDYRKRGKQLAEIGRMIIPNQTHSLLKAYYHSFYIIAKSQKIDIVLFVMQQDNIVSHKKMMGIKVLSSDVGADYCENTTFSCVAWELANTKPQFFKWIRR